jgi:hypothetical protein
MIIKYIANPKMRSSKAMRIGSLLDYIEADVRGGAQKAEYVCASGSFYSDSLQGQRAEMIALAMEATRSKDPVDHWLMSWKEGEQPTHAQCNEAIEILKKHLGMSSDHLVSYALHRNTENYHLHAVLNRVDPNTMRVTDKGWCIDKAHKAIAEIVHTQGWEQEDNARYIANSSGEVSLARVTCERQPCSKTRDHENATGEKSFERIAIERAAPILTSAKNWEQAHKDLRRAGMRYELKGSGALLWVNDQPVKASVIGREFSRKCMEERLGVFQPEAGSVVTKQPPRQAESIHRDDSGRWAQYRKALEDHRAWKNTAQTQQRIEHRSEREALFASFRKQRGDFYQNGRWSGSALNVARSLMASNHAKRKAQLSEEHKRERNALRLQFGTRLTFEQFLVAQGEQQAAAAWRYREAPEAKAALFGDGDEQPLKHDIRDFTAQVKLGHGRTVGIHYTRRNTTEISFTDSGKRIDIWRMSDEASVLAALQLGAQKWGALTITGPTEFKLLCVDLAAKHGIKINNPELQTAIAKSSRTLQPVPRTSLETTTPDGAYRLHRADILNRIKVRNPSHLDWMIAVRMRVTGHDQQTIAKVLRDNARGGRESENRDWANYAERTAEAVFGPRGDRDSNMHRLRAYSWAQVEGRDLAREQATRRESLQRSQDRQQVRGGLDIGY